MNKRMMMTMRAQVPQHQEEVEAPPRGALGTGRDIASWLTRTCQQPAAVRALQGPRHLCGGPHMQMITMRTHTHSWPHF